jgi:hypothetical protein
VNSGNASFSLYDSDGNSQWSLASSPAGKFVFWDDLNGKGPFTIESNASDNALYVQSTGNVGIGTASPGYPLDVVGGVNASGGYTSVSDGRLKTDMQPLADSLSKVLKLQGITFHWIDRAKYGDDRQIGLIAQELEKVFPELVKTNAQGFKSVNYSGLVMPTIEAVKSLHGRLEEQGRELNQVKAENTALKAQVRALGDYLCAQNPAAGFCAK